MSQTVNQTNTPRQTTAAPATFPGGRVTFANMLRSEWTKFWSVRSTWWTLGVLAVIVIGFGILAAQLTKLQPTAMAGAAGKTYATDPPGFGLAFGQLVMGILAVLVIGSEYSTGEIRTSLLTAPGRWRMLVAKTVVIAVVSFLVTVITVYVVVLCGWPLIHTFAIDNRFTGDGLRVIAGDGLAITLIALMALGIGVLVRNSALGIGIVVVLCFVLPMVGIYIPVHWVQTACDYLISNSISGLTDPSGTAAAIGDFSFAKSLWVSLIWAFVPLICGAVILRKRDA